MDFFKYWNNRHWINGRNEGTENKAVKQADGMSNQSPVWHSKKWETDECSIN